LSKALSKELFPKNPFERYASTMPAKPARRTPARDATPAATPTPPEVRRVTDPGELRALAHPLRLRLLEELVVDDPLTDTATATELAERVGESPANCSWHLRQLAKYGYIEEAPGGVGRERRWRAVIATREWTPESVADAEFSAAARAAGDILLAHEFEALRARHAWEHTEPPEWRDAAASTQGLAWCTAAELKEINKQIADLMTRHFERALDPSKRPDGARLVRFVSWGFPARPQTATSPEETPDA
jgi:DNA-binding transcriptional ArsR family regulator